MLQKVVNKITGSRIGVLERKIAISIILFSTAIALLATTFQIWFEYQKDVNEVGKRFEIIEHSYLESLSSALWVMDPIQVKTIAEGIYSLPDVSYVRIHWEDGKEFIRLGSRQESNVIERMFQLTFPNNQEQFRVGSIFVSLTLESVVKRTFSRFILIILTNSLKTIIVCVFIFYILHQFITKHLNKMSDYLIESTHQGVLKLDHKNGTILSDEIDIVANGINKMQQELLSHISEISEQKEELEDSVHETANALKLALEEKTNLLRVVCHDLANPLSIVSGSIEMLNLPNFPEQKKLERIRAIERASDLMTDILGNVREMESLSSGKKNLEMESVDLENIFANVEFVFRDRLKEKNINLEISNHVPEGISCLADPISLSNQVINNLVSNAIKFSYNQNTIEIKAHLEGDLIHITVSDHGVGMSQDHLAKIFDPNSQTTRTGTNGETGTGFGMPLVKTFVEKYGGTIKVDSVSVDLNPVGHGSSFHIYLKTA